jgi:hypothetical protein
MPRYDFMTDNGRFFRHSLKFLIHNHVIPADVVQDISGMRDTILGLCLSTETKKNSR